MYLQIEILPQKDELFNIYKKMNYLLWIQEVPAVSPD